eukprot:GDKI01012967.1.p1 GENE.GDKI01012967.1~~GDKI01012967.1.p1  ORF type:complete len:181 (+),score=64.35 GDKI01012967.1:116-658(+)
MGILSHFLLAFVAVFAALSDVPFACAHELTAAHKETADAHTAVDAVIISAAQDSEVQRHEHTAAAALSDSDVLTNTNAQTTATTDQKETAVAASNQEQETVQKQDVVKQQDAYTSHVRGKNLRAPPSFLAVSSVRQSDARARAQSEFLTVVGAVVERYMSRMETSNGIESPFLTDNDSYI